VTRGDKTHVPFPVFCLMEEAHNFAPASADAVTTEIAQNSPQRRAQVWRVSVGLITQRPGKLDSDVLSQCMTQCIMRITNPIDQEQASPRRWRAWGAT
jgi:DNA helicase HerA-like ATPase